MWKNKGGVVSKLSLIKKSFKEKASGNYPKEVKEEINYVLDEIENADDRNTIYMSSWLSRRLAMRYKNYLATLKK